jgi:hypothetical protein
MTDIDSILTEFLDYKKRVEGVIPFEHSSLIEKGTAILDALKKLEVSNNQWTKELPTEPGIYAIGKKRSMTGWDSKPIIIEVHERYLGPIIPGLLFGDYLDLDQGVCSISINIKSDQLSGYLWYGPIIIPKPPTEEELNV